MKPSEVTLLYIFFGLFLYTVRQTGNASSGKGHTPHNYGRIF
jgi:hypothetical protein